MNTILTELKGVKVRSRGGVITNFNKEKAVGSMVMAGLPSELAIETASKATQMLATRENEIGEFQIKSNDLINLFWMLNKDSDIFGAVRLIDSLGLIEKVTLPIHNRIVVKGENVEFELYEDISNDTFNEPGVIATRYQFIDGKRTKTLTMALKRIARDLQQLGDALLTVEAAFDKEPVDDEKLAAHRFKTAVEARSLIVRHGKLTVFENSNAKTTFFINDRGFYIEYPGLGPSGPDFLAIPVTPSTVPPIFASTETRDKEDVTVFMEENVFGPGPMEHWYSPLANAFAFLNPFWDYLEDLDDFCDEVIDDIDSDECIEELRVHSHGNSSLIRMGGDNITLSDFDAAGNPKPGNVKDWLDKLKPKMCNPSEIIFDACGQGRGDMLRYMSNYLGPNVTVSGFSGLGNPVTGGDLHFT